MTYDESKLSQFSLIFRKARKLNFCLFFNNRPALLIFQYKFTNFYESIGNDLVSYYGLNFEKFSKLMKNSNL